MKLVRRRLKLYIHSWRVSRSTGIPMAVLLDFYKPLREGRGTHRNPLTDDDLNHLMSHLNRPPNPND